MSVYNSVIFKDFNLTPRAKQAYLDAYKLSKKLNHNNINNLHVLYGCMKNCCSQLREFLLRNGVALTIQDVLDAIKEAEKTNKDKFYSSDKSDPWHKEVSQAIKSANDLSNDLEQHYIGLEHVFNGILNKSSYVFELLDDFILDIESLKEEISYFIKGEDQGDPLDFSDLIEQNIDTVFYTVDDQPDDEKSQISLPDFSTPEFTTSLNELYHLDKLPDVYGREDEVDLLIETISKKNKCNAILTGDAGVGKTSIVEALAARICRFEVPSNLLGMEILSVDLGSIVAGTQYRGQFEQRFKELLKFAKNNPHTVLFFDEIHTLFGAGGNQEGGLDAVNMLKPLLARGEVKCIGSTTQSEYEKIFNKDGAMKRRFHNIIVGEPSKQETKHILYNCKSKYEDFHNVKFSKPIIDFIVDSSDSLISNKKFPDKAFDILDQVGSRVKIKNLKPSKELLNSHKSLVQCMVNGSVEEEEMKEKFKELVEDLNEMVDFSRFKPYNIKKNDVCEIVAEHGNVSIDQVNNSTSGFNSFLKRISSEVFGQSKILSQINDSLGCAKAGLTDPDKPLASMFFVGPTSVGKTYTAKKIAKHFFGNERAILQVNMSELQDKTGVSKLIGANSGYVGYEEGGMLTKFVKENPNCVVLFDEIEKADPQILNILLHLLDEGYVEDNKHNKISFSNAIVILTSNIGHADFSKKSMGFVQDEEDKDSSYKDSIKKQLKPELLARINDIFVFEDLSDNDFKRIIINELDKIKSKLFDNKKIKFSFNKNIVDLIFEKIKSQKLHARDIKNFVRDEVQVPVSKFVISKSKTSEISIKSVDKKIKVC